MTKKYVALALLLTGCATPTYNIERDSFHFSLIIDPDLPTNGLAKWNDNICVIWLRKYPECLLHEIRHCIEGYWHDTRPNLEDC
jgi:hypothetical protein